MLFDWLVAGDWSGYIKESIDAAPESPVIGRTRSGTCAKYRAKSSAK
jgi:hypothetical protein